MKKVQAYKCDHCPKTSTNAGAMAQHERKCSYNQNNRHKCFDYCKFLKRTCNERGHTEFSCEWSTNKLYSYKAEHRGMDLKSLTRMPLTCDLHEYMDISKLEE